MSNEIISRCCGVDPLIGINTGISKGTYDGITITMGYCSKCRNSTLFSADGIYVIKEEKGK